MTVVNVTAYIATLTGGNGAVNGTLMCTPWAGTSPATVTSGQQVTFGEPITVPIQAGVPVVTVDLPPNTVGQWCWQVVLIVTGAQPVTRYVNVPTSGPVAWAALVNVDPSTLVPSTTVAVTAWANVTTRSPVAQGAKLDGVTDDSAALRATAALCQPGDVLVIPAGTLLCSPAASTGVVVTLPAGVTLRVEGTLRLASGVGSSWTSIVDMNSDCTITGRGLIDCNPTGNPITTAPAPGTRFVARATPTCTGDLLVQGIRVYGHIGHNAIYFSVGTLQGLTVIDCTFTGTGQGVPAAAAHDHSTLYLEGRSITVRGNRFVGATGYSAHAAIETHGASQIVTGNIVENYVILGNLTGVQLLDGDNILWAHNIARQCMIGIALYATSAEGGPSPALRNVTIQSNSFTIDRDWGLQYAPQDVAPVPCGIYLSSGTADRTIEQLTIADNTITFTPYATPSTTDEFNASGIELWRVTPNAAPDKNVRILRNTIINPPAAAIRYAAGSTTDLTIRDNTIVDPGGTLSTVTAASYRTGVLVTGGSHTNIDVTGNLVFDSRATHKINSGVDVSNVAAVTGGRVVGNPVKTADGVYVLEAITPNGAGKQFYLESEQTTWQGFFTSCAAGSKVRVPSTGATYVNVTTADGAAPVWVQQIAGQINLSDTMAGFPATTLGTLSKKLPLYDKTGTVVVGWVPLYTSIT